MQQALQRSRPDVRYVIGGPASACIMHRVVLDCRHGASSMEGGPDERYHIRWIGCAQGDRLRGDCRERPRWGGTRGWRIREPPRRPTQNGGSAWQAAASPQLLLR